MNLVMLNGSPRGNKSNTQLLLNQLCIGMNSVNDIECKTFYLRNTENTQEHIDVVKAADLVVLGFPLYTDGMPGVVKHFIDNFVPVDLHGKPMAFLVQSGFPEAKHSRPVARYLENLCKRINATHCGTIIRGNTEGIRLRSEHANQKIFKQFNGLGVSLAYDGKFKQDLLEKVAGPEELTWAMKQVYKTPMINNYWNMMLKKNKAFEKRYDAPYGPAFKNK